MDSGSSQKQIKKAVETIFQKYDTDKSGNLDRSEMRKVIQDILFNVNNGKTVTDDDVNRVMSAIDVNGDGKISKEELEIIIRRCYKK